MKLVKRETIFSEARCSFILCRDGAAYKISAPKMIQHRGHTVVYMLKVISILWDSSKRNCISPFFIKRQNETMWSFSEFFSNRFTQDILNQMHGCSNCTSWLDVGHYRNEMSCGVWFCGDWLMGQRRKGDSHASTAPWPGYAVAPHQQRGIDSWLSTATNRLALYSA